MKKITFKAFSLFFIGLAVFNVNGQTIKKSNNVQQFGKEIKTENSSNPSGFVRCATTEYEAYLKAQFPTRQTTEEFEAWLAPKIEQFKSEKAAGRAPQAVYNIPVVIHIVHNGDCLGTGENITDAQAASQIKVMNEDYRRMMGTPGGANSTGLAVDSEINFYLAKRDPSGNPTNGIDHVETSIASYDRAAVETEKANTIWDPTKYLNMWTFRFSGDLAGVLGYAQFPTGSTLSGIPAGTTTANTDGVVASYDAFGTADEDDGTFILNATYNLGRTMTHEVGHWLGLRHIWGDNNTCPAFNSNTNKDYCADTPAANAPNYDCNLTADSCPSNPGNDMVQNYMDYTNDACMDTFTADQKTRMQTVMTNSPRRSTLNASNGATAPSAGVYFKQNANTCSITESIGCAFIDVNYPIAIIKAPTQNTVISFALGGTATNNVDYEILTPTVTFASGTTTNQVLTIRYFNDGFVEGTETLTVTMVVNANGGDGSLITSKSTLNLTIEDNDSEPNTTYPAQVFYDGFESYTDFTVGNVGGWINNDLDLDNSYGLNAIDFTNENYIGSYIVFNSSTTSPDSSGGLLDSHTGNKGYYCFNSTGNVSGSPLNNDWAITPQISLGTNSQLNFWAKSYTDTYTGGERFNVLISTTNTNTTSFTKISGNPFTVPPTTWNEYIFDLSAYDGQNVYIAIQCVSADEFIFMLDDVSVTSNAQTNVQTEVNTGTAFQASVLSAGTFFAKDASTGDVIADGTADAFNYGCTTVSVNRSITSAGSPAVNYGSNTANNLKVMAKTVTVTPTTNNPSGNASFKFYFTEAEIAAWETATGNSRSALKVFKGGENITYATTIGAFGTNVTLSAATTSGLGGVYYFGTDATLTSDTFDALSAISVYPNPTSNLLNVTIPSQLGSNVSYEIFNYLGQTVKKAESSSSNFSINTSGFSNGVYIIKLNVEGANKTLRFIKN